jgi:hypothetical protein
MKTNRFSLTSVMQLHLVFRVYVGDRRVVNGALLFRFAIFETVMDELNGNGLFRS